MIPSAIPARIERAVTGWGDVALSLVLFAAATLLALVAVFAPTSAKAFVLAWIALP